MLPPARVSIGGPGGEPANPPLGRRNLYGVQSWWVCQLPLASLVFEHGSGCCTMRAVRYTPQNSHSPAGGAVYFKM